MGSPQKYTDESLKKMLEVRSRFPRYDGAQLAAKELGMTRKEFTLAKSIAYQRGLSKLYPAWDGQKARKKMATKGQDSGNFVARNGQKRGKYAKKKRGFTAEMPKYVDIQPLPQQLAQSQGRVAIIICPLTQVKALLGGLE